MNNFYDKLCEITSADNIHINEEMKKHTTFQIGGPADYYMCPASIDEMCSIIALCKHSEMPFYIMGNGSNLLVADKGFRGVIIQTHENLNKIEVTDNEIHAMAGASLSKIAHTAMENSLAGFEFASGIPGSLGGACIMNAGAYDGEMKQVLKSARAIDENMNIVEFSGDEMELGYRSSAFAKRGLIVLDAVISLTPGDSQVIKDEIDRLTKTRTSKQPLDYPSAGSTFKRPEGYFAGKLIRDSGLSGASVGGAMVSPKHNGFVINTGGATAKDITDLMSLVVSTVKDKFGVEMEPEVKRIGDFN